MQKDTIRLLYQGVDTLDIAVMGAVSGEVLAALEMTRATAEANPQNEYGVMVKLGAPPRDFVVKAHGKRGGYRYTVVDVDTGSIISIKRDLRQTMWNLFVSARAHTLLSRGYEGTKAALDACLTALGVATREISVNRIDYALDFLAPSFTLDTRNVVVPPRCKVASTSPRGTISTTPPRQAPNPRAVSPLALLSGAGGSKA